MTMYTDIRLHELQQTLDERERQRQAARQDMLRLATIGRSMPLPGFRAKLGAMLITVGEALRQDPARSALERQPHLSPSKT